MSEPDSEPTLFEWTGSGPLRRGRDRGDWVWPADVFEPTDAEAESFADLMREVETGSPAGATAEAEAGTDARADAPADDEAGGDADESERGSDVGAGAGGRVADLAGAHWQTVVATVERGDADDALDELEAAERDRDRPRDSVLDAIEERRE